MLVPEQSKAAAVTQQGREKAAGNSVLHRGEMDEKGRGEKESPECFRKRDGSQVGI